MPPAVNLQISSSPCKWTRPFLRKSNYSAELEDALGFCSAPCPPRLLLAASCPRALLAIHEFLVPGAPHQAFLPHHLSLCLPLPTGGLGARSQCRERQTHPRPWIFSGVAFGPGLDSTMELSSQKGGSGVLFCLFEFSVARS